jgi:hypothetical protein
MASDRGDGDEIEWVWKEVVIYWEGDRQGLQRNRDRARYRRAVSRGDHPKI